MIVSGVERCFHAGKSVWRPKQGTHYIICEAENIYIEQYTCVYIEKRELVHYSKKTNLLSFLFFFNLFTPSAQREFINSRSQLCFG